MSYYDSIESAARFYSGLATLFWILLVVMLIANFVAMATLINIAKDKGHYRDGAGVPWFIGLCGTSFMLGLIVIALPDRSGAVSPRIPSNHYTATPSSAPAELPEV